MAEQLESSASFKMPSRLPEDLKEELNAIASIYSGKDEVAVLETSATTGVTETKDGHVTIQVSPDQCTCKVIFTLSEDYPAKPPARIEVSEKDTQIKRLPDDTLQTILQTLYQAAQECLGNPMIFTLVEKFKEQLQEHSGKDGQGVENELLASSGSLTPEFRSDEDEPKPKKREKSKKKKRSQADDTSGIQTKKPPMKTATDVIHRIMWDECLNKDDFTVGYLDRFVGILEERFSIFDWGDIAEADFLALAVPRHRIQYFKYKDITVWDKTQRLDLVFGSTGSSTTIRDIIKRFEKEDGHVEEKEACEPESNGEEMMVDEGEAEGSTEVITNLNETEDANEAKQGRAKTSNRVTHFLAVRITAPEVIENVQKFQEKVCEADQALKRACIVPEKLHITLGVMRLETSEEEELAAKVLKDLEGELALCFSPSTLLHFKRIECWQSRVVVSPVEGQEEKESLQKGMRMILSKLQEVGIEVKEERREFTPHLTAMKVKFAMRKKKNKKKISEEVVRPHQDFQLGCQDVDEIHLCSMIGKPREDGFYQTLATVSASLESI